MKTTLFKVLWWIVFAIMLTIGIFSFMMLIAECENLLYLIATKIIAIVGFISTYFIYKWLYKNQ